MPSTPTLSAAQKECLMVLAFLYLQNGKYTEGKILLEGLHHLYPTDDHILRSLAFAYLEDGDYEHALMLTEQAQSQTLSPKHHNFFHLIKSKAFWRLGKKQESRQAMSLFIQTLPQLS